VSNDKQNITLALPRRLLRAVKVLAAERDTSISAILTGLLEGFVRQESEYDRAMREEIARMKKGYDLGTQGRRTWTRDDLHER
jgi:hypothetical protein